MHLHREGAPTLLLATAAFGFIAFALLQWPVLPAPLNSAVIVLLAVVLALLFWFFRVPRRSSSAVDHAVLSPCDGRVVAIERVHEPEHFQDDRRQVSIFMSPLNVHVNWFPISGTIAYKRYHPGRYLVAWHPKSSTENERSTLVVRHPAHGEVLFRQIAGALARRIVTYGEEGGPARRGTEFGFIKFGSRVDLFLPLDAAVKVSIGQRVRGAESVIAEFNTAN
ncbi:MAG: phosphatidylserine decarboxylase family protein [Flavobacteriales bacterium]|jgi:phosphatidylserine decarboxylase|nr:phosphatidylserine decarboxylase family protein [Flavobacteriales bacterium]